MDLARTSRQHLRPASTAQSASPSPRSAAGFVPGPHDRIKWPGTRLGLQVTESRNPLAAPVCPITRVAEAQGAPDVASAVKFVDDAVQGGGNRRRQGGVGGGPEHDLGVRLIDRPQLPVCVRTVRAGRAMPSDRSAARAVAGRRVGK